MNLLVPEDQVAEALGISPRTVRNRAVADLWPMDKRPKQGGFVVSYIRKLLPFDVQEILLIRESITCNNVPSVKNEMSIPEQDRKNGLSKYYLVHFYRLAKEKAVAGRETAAAKDFLLAYNAGLLMPNIFAVLGEVYERTIEAMDKKLLNNKDNYLSLCDGWDAAIKKAINDAKTEAEGSSLVSNLFKNGFNRMVDIVVEERNNRWISSSRTEVARYLKDLIKIVESDD